jgi:8-amino-7-oxononanoate synthase
MDADSPDLPALRRLCDEHGAALIVDEAHALGVLGPGGRGLLAASQVQAEVTIGTLGKAFGGGGAFVGGCPALIAWLWNRARTFVFSTGLSPVLARAGREALEAVEGDPSLRGHRVLGYGHIVPWVVGDARAAMTFATQIQREGLAVQAIRPPSVPAGTSRLRLTASASQSRPDVARLVEAIARLQP